MLEKRRKDLNAMAKGAGQMNIADIDDELEKTDGDEFVLTGHHMRRLAMALGALWLADIPVCTF
jgi:hypothetical protein